MHYKVLFLDFYGTIVQDDDKILAEITKEISDHAAAPTTPQEVANYWWGGFRSLFQNSHGDAYQSQRVLAHQSLQDAIVHFQCEGLSADIDGIMYEYWCKPEIFPDSFDFLNQINIPVCYVTNIDRADFASATGYHNLSYENLVTSQDAGSYKPRPEIFRMALQVMHAQPQSVLHVGDSLTSDVAGAQNCGIDAFWLNRMNRDNKSDISPKFSGSSLMDVLRILGE